MHRDVSFYLYAFLKEPDDFSCKSKLLLKYIKCLNDPPGSPQTVHSHILILIKITADRNRLMTLKWSPHREHQAAAGHLAPDH